MTPKKCSRPGRAGVVRIASLCSVIALAFGATPALAAVAYRSSGSFTGSGNACTAPMPAGVVAGDVLLLVVESENEAISLSTPNGFVEVTNSPQFAGTALTEPANRIAVFWKRAVGGDASPVAADAGDHTTCQLHAFSGAVTSGNPWDVTSGGNDAGLNDATAVIPGATTTVANTLVVLVQGNSNNGNSTANCGAATNAALAAITERSDNSSNQGLGGGHCLIIGTKATAGAIGDTTLTLSVSSYKGAMSIALKPAILVTGVTVNPTSATISAGGTRTISATALPANATDRNVNWTTGAGCDASDGVSPASTLGDGAATTTFTAGTTGTFPRTCAVTATAADGSGFSATSSITINPILVTGVSVNPTSATISAGGTRTLSATASPAGATNRDVSWTKGAGCDALDSVSPASTVTGVSVTPATATIQGGATQALSATASPAGATNRNVSWTKISGCDANDTVSPATTAGDGVATTTFTAFAGGTIPRSCVVRATAADGSGVFGETTITVSGIAVSGVAIAPTSASVQVSATQQFTATISPGGATNQSVNWSVLGGAGCGTVGATGLYTAPAAVTAGCSVRVTTVDGGFTADATVTLTAGASVAIGDASTGEAATTLVPGAAKIVLDAFTLAASVGTATPESITVTMPGGSAEVVGLLTVENTSACDQASPYGWVNPSSDTPTITVSSLTVGISAVPLWICVAPKSHAAMPPPPGTQVAVTGQVTGVVATGFSQTGSDTVSPARTIDNRSPDAPSGLGGSAGDGYVDLTWTNPAGNAQIVLLRWNAATPGVEVPQEGRTPDYAVGNVVGLATVACVEAAPASSCHDANVLNGAQYVYKAFSRDANRNFSVGAQAGPYSPSGPFVAEGSTTAGAPMVSIVNPLRGSVVSGEFRVQIRVANAGGVDAVSGVAYSTNDGGTWDTAGLTSTTAYDTTTLGVVTGRMFEVRLTPAPGTYTLRARASNAVASNVVSNGVPIVAKASKTGDGNLLVRDNSSQLCSDCHAHKGHTSESTESARGSWSTTCRDCHTPHRTRNVALVAEQITPPQITAQQGPKTVTFYGKTGFAAGSYASAGLDGPCQVCHTRTKFYRGSGVDVPDPAFPASTVASGGHNPTGACVTCHKHGDGLAASCFGCHGDAGRGSAPGADAQQAAAPPQVATGATVFVAGGGAHLAHVNLASWRQAPLHCVACHPSPNTHQGDTEVSWSLLATTGSVAVTPPAGALDGAWTATPSCTNWCHGAGLAGGGGTAKTTPPRWTDASAPCGSCHASPPPLGGGVANVHPQNTSCSSCHGGDYAETSVGALAKPTHIDGTVQKPENGCTACHGLLSGIGGPVADNTSFLAMPGYEDGLGGVGSDTRGRTERTVVRVGAHDAHGKGRYIAPQDCAVCHGGKPASGNRDHADGTIAFGYGAVPSSNGVATQPPAFNAAFESSPGCTNYCHSTGKPLGLAATPKPATWTSTVQMTCTTCHETAALSTHAHPLHVATQGVGCQACHAGTTDNGSSIVSGGGLHVDSQNDVRFTVTDLTWSAFFSGASQYEADHTCSATYCHSNGTSPSSPFGAPVGAALAWNAGSGSATCTSCHGGAQGAPVVIGVGAGNGTARHQAHVANATTLGANYFCGDCHKATVDAGTNGPITTASNHVDRARQVSIANRGPKASTDPVGGSCTAVYCHSSGQATPAYVAATWTGGPALGCNGCHGTGNVTGAPDYPQLGPAGGADANTHGKHTSFGTNPASCQNCHYSIVNATADALFATSHTNGYRDVLIAPSFDTNGATTNYNPVSKTCMSVSCHGIKTPRWGDTLGCTDCHGKSTRPSISGADANQQAAPPDGVNGETLESARAVGEHEKHVNDNALRQDPLACNDCHNGASHNGTRDLGWSQLATSTSRTITWNGTTCANTYCHAPGAVAADIGGTNRTPSWTGGTTASCNWCHGNPPPVTPSANANHPSNTNCANCHGTGYTGPTMGAAAKATHLTGNTRVGIDKPQNGCRACHGQLAGVGGAAANNTDPAAAPGYNGVGVDTWGAWYAASVAVGAHDAHVRPNGSLNAIQPLGCVSCHPNRANGNTDHADGAVDMAWTTLASSTAITVAPAAGQITAGWQASPTCTNYCHSNAAPVGGTQTTTPQPNWTSSANMTCTSCHQVTADNPLNPASTKLSHGHWLHITAAVANGGYFYNCSQCHNATATGQSDGTGLSITAAGRANHVSGVHTVVFDTAMNPGSTSYAQGPSYTCANTYCHSNGTNAASPPANTSIAWTATKTCYSCHGFTAADPVVVGSNLSGQKNGSITHLTHVANSAKIGTNYRCGDCHNTTVQAGTDGVFVSTAQHVDRTKQVAISARGTRTSTSPAAGNPFCASVYCHSSGQDPNATAHYEPVGWTSVWPANMCKNCHGAFVAGDGAVYGFASQFGEPNYTSGAAGSATANDHQEHVKTSVGACVNCHYSITNATADALFATSHTNGVRDVVINPSFDTNGATTNYNPVSKTCMNVSCHGTATPRWGGTVSCLDCHGGSADVEYIGTTFWSDDLVAIVSTREWTYSGHGKASGKYESDNPAAAFPTSPTPGKTECLFCHDDAIEHELAGNPFRLRGRSRSGGATFDPYTSGTMANYACLNCHATGSFGVFPTGASLKNGTLKPDMAHGGAKHTLLTQGGNFCWDCHDPHGDRPSNTNSSGYNVFMIRKSVIVKGDGVHGYLGTAGATVDVEFYTTTAPQNAPSPVGRAAETTTAAGTTHKGLCQACHDTTAAPSPATAWTKYWEKDGRDDPDGNGGTGAYASGVTTGAHHNTTQYCIDCHPHNDNFAGNGTCLGCHGQSADNDDRTGTFWSNANRAEFNLAEWTWSGHGKTGVTYDVTGNQPANFSTAPNPGESECRYCHDETTGHNPGAAGNPYRLRGVSTGGTTAAWSTAAPNAVCLNCHSSSSSPGVTPSGQTNKKATTFVVDTHYGSKHAAGEGGQFCWDCHDAHGERISGSGNILMIRSQVFKATDGTYGINPTLVNVTFNQIAASPPAVGKLVEATNATRVGLCQACHDPSKAGTQSTRYWRSNGTDDPDGSTGAAAYTSLHDSTETNAQFCLRCHTHSAKFETGNCGGCHLTTGNDTGAFSGTFWKDLNPSLISSTEWGYSGHGKKSGNYDGSTNPPANFPSTPTPLKSECKFCHDDALAHVSGARGDTNPYLLRGAADASGVTAAFNATSTNFGNDVCLNCHGSSSSPGVMPADQATPKKATQWVAQNHMGTKHQGTEGGKFCWDCHDPHGDRPSNTTAAGQNILMIRSQVFQITDGTYGINPTLKNVTWNSRAGSPPAVGKLVEATTATRIGLCQACHDPAKGTDATVGSTKYWRWNGSDNAVSPSTHNATETDPTYCIKCHAHKDDFAGKGGGPNCFGCHSGGQGGTRALSGDFTGKSHHVRTNVGAFSTTGTTEAAGWGTNRDCVVCHAEGQIVTGPSADCATGTFPTTCTNPSYHGNGKIDLRDVDVAAPAVDASSATAAFVYDSNFVATSAGAAANWYSGNQAWREWTSGVEEPGGVTLPTKAGLDRFCLNCHDADGALQISSFRVSTETNRASTDPFWDGADNIKNNYDTFNRSNTAAGSTTVPPATGGRVVDIKSKVSGAPPAQGAFSRHAIRGQSTSRYTKYTGAISYGATIYDGGYFVQKGVSDANGPLWNDTSVMGCADCHTVDGANGTAGSAHGSTAAEYLLKDSSGGAALGSYPSGNYVCARCHVAGSYSTSGSHGPTNGSDFQDGSGLTYNANVSGSRKNPGGKGGTVFGLACLNCHGGAQGNGSVSTDTNGFGWIHGTSQVFGNGVGGTRNAYRFMNGSSLRFYSPGEANPENWQTSSFSCYTLSGTTDTWGSCTQHSTGKSMGAGSSRARALNY